MNSTHPCDRCCCCRDYVDLPFWINGIGFVCVECYAYLKQADEWLEFIDKNPPLLKEDDDDDYPTI